MTQDVKECIKAAENYYFNHPDRLHFNRKPFHSIHETPLLLSRLALILQNLYVGQSQRVVDFGAGSCWISLILNKMGVSTVSIDVSPSALEIGRYLFEQEPFIRSDVKSEFLLFDGYHIDLPDESIDRIICFDAYHHIPNTLDVLRELNRILVYGGMAAFAEPGEHHSSAPLSIKVVEEFGVVENDVVLDQVWKEAKEVGFTDMTIIPFIKSQGITLRPKPYQKYLKGSSRTFPHKINRQNLREEQVFYLHKGPLLLDSRAPVKLMATLILESESYKKVHSGENVDFTLKVTNKCDATFKVGPYSAGGFVQLGAHLEKIMGDVSHMIDFDFLRVPLPHDILPKETIKLIGTFNAPLTPGKYRISFDMVCELVNWFEDYGSKPAFLLLELQP